MKEKMDYKPFIGKKITKIEEKNNWLRLWKESDEL